MLNLIHKMLKTLLCFILQVLKEKKNTKVSPCQAELGELFLAFAPGFITIIVYNLHFQRVATADKVKLGCIGLNQHYPYLLHVHLHPTSVK